MTASRILVCTVLVASSVGPGCRCVSGGDRPEEGNGPPSDNSRSEGSAWDRGELPPSALEGEPRRGGEITVHIRTDPPSLNTLVDSDGDSTRITEHRIYESLLRIKRYDHPNYGIEPELARAMPTVSEDGRVHTFQLRQDVLFHDGQAFDADDVLATFVKVRDEATRAAHIRSYLEELETVEKIDSHTVRFTWRQPYFLAFDTYAELPILPAHRIADLSGAEFNESDTNPLNRAPVGTGPWKFDEWVPNERIVVERNADHWERAPYLDRVTFRIVKEATTALQLVERGEMDTLEQPEAAQWANMNQPSLRENYWRSRFFGSNYAWIGWNHKNALFRDRRVRRALTLLINRPAIIERLLYGLPQETQCHFYSPRPECELGVDPVPYDPEAAVALLEEAGWTDHDGDGVRDKNGRRFEFTFMVPSSAQEATRWVTAVKEDFERAGLELNIQRQEWQTFVRRLREHEFDACTLLWGSSGPRGDPTQIWHSNSIEGGSNYIEFRNERADEIMEQARVSLDEDVRTRLYREFGRILHEEQPYTWMYTRPELALISTRLRGVRPSLGWWFPQDWWLAEETSAN